MARRMDRPLAASAATLVRPGARRRQVPTRGGRAEGSASTIPARALAIAGLALAAAAAPAAALDVQIVNQSGRPDAEVYVTLSGGASSDGVLAEDAPVRLSDVPGQRFSVGAISAARLTFAYGGGAQLATSPITSPLRFDKIEFTNPGDVNLTSVDFFGIPLAIETLSSDGRVLQRRRFRCDADTVRAQLLKVPGARRALKRGPGGEFLRVLSPSLRPRSYPSLVRYVRSLKGTPLRINGRFNGSPAASYRYTARISKRGAVRLEGTIQPVGGSRARGKPIKMAGGRAFSNSIYSANGRYTVGGAPAFVGQNDVYSAIYRDLVSGFAFGYWGGRFGNNSGRWRGKPQFAAARRGKARYATYSQYAAVINRFSDAYGYPFSDVGPKPILAPLNASTAGLRVTIMPDRSPTPQAGCPKA